MKASSSVSAVDGRGLARLAERCGNAFAGGVVFHMGRDVLPLPDPRMVAAPISELWTR